MSRSFHRSVLTLTSVALAIVVPLPASADRPAPPAAAGVLYVDSDALPEGQTGVSNVPALLAVTATSAAAKQLEIQLDGKPLPTRTFSRHGTRARTQFQIAPTSGWHHLALTVVDARGNRSATRNYSFGARPPASSRDAATASLVVGGRFTEADGSPAIHLPVSVYPVQMGGASGTVSPIASTTTAADGTWTATLPPASSTLKKWAADNDGVLNLQAVAQGVADDPKTGAPREMVAVSSFTTGIADAGKISTAAQAALGSAVPTAPLLPVRRLSELPHSPDVAPAVDAPTPAAPSLTAEQASHERPTYFGAATVTGTTDDTVAARRVGDSDYTAQPVFAGSPAEQSGALAPITPAAKDQCTIENALVTRRTSGTTQYTVALESHAAQDAKGSVTYSRTAGTSLTKGLSYDVGKHWSVNGSIYVGNQTGFSSGFTRGPNFSYQWKVPVSYGYYTIYQCKMIKGVKTLVYRYNATYAEKVAIPNGGYTGQFGKNVSSYDGYYGYRDAPYKTTVRRGTFFQIDENTSKTTSGGASAWGFSVTSTTSKATVRAQRIDAGTAQVNHYIFGYEPVGSGMKVFYSY
jgi:hypothetical protein